jgi:hypothetical protein
MAAENEGTPESLAAYFLSGEGFAGHDAGGHAHGDDGTSVSVREFEHDGHEVRIETTYRISIDGRPLPGHVEVLPSGAVHYHRFPQYAPSSAVDIVKTVIDTLWEKPDVPDELGEPPDDGTGGHEHGGHEHGGHA